MRVAFQQAVYSVALPDGTTIVERNGAIESSTDGRIPRGDILALQATRYNGVLYLAGQGHDDGFCWLWSAAKGWQNLGQSYGVRPCAFGSDSLYWAYSGESIRRLHLDTGEITTIVVGGGVGSQGIRFVDGERIYRGDDTLFDGSVHEWISRGDVRVGQGRSGGCLINGRILEPGDCQFITFERDGDKLAVAIVKFLEGQSVLHYLTRAEVDALPLPPQPQPQPKPQPQPEPPPKPEPKPQPAPQPQPERLPPLRTAERFWFGPNIDSVDLLQCGDVDLSDVDVFSLYVQWIVEDRRYDALKASGLLKKLRAQGLPLCIEMGSIKPDDWHAEHAIDRMPWMVDRVKALGYETMRIKMDEPLTAVKLRPEQPFDESVFAVAKFIEAADNLGIQVGWIEAWPEIDLETQRKFLMGLDSWGRVPAFWHLDIDWHRAQSEGKDAHQTIALAKKYADDYQMPLGVYFAGYSHATDEEYQQDVLSLADGAIPNVTDIDHVLVQAWATRTGTNRQDLPQNLGPRGLLETFRLVRLTYA